MKLAIIAGLRFSAAWFKTIDPYGEAWIIKIKVNDVAELDGLLDAAAYEAKIG